MAPCSVACCLRSEGEGKTWISWKKVHFAIKEDQVKKLRFVKHIASEKDKNHGEGTVSALNGCIPFINFGRLNPGSFFEKYLDALPDESTKPGIEGGFLFMKTKINAKKFNMHSPDANILFEANVKVGKNYAYKMMGELCSILGRPHQTNHSLRNISLLSAVIYMRRSGLSWQTIAKITGHKKIDNLIKHYDTIMEAQGFVDVAVAIATGPAVAQGQSPVKVNLSNRLDRKKMSVVLDGVECHGLKEQTDQMLNEQTDQVLKEQGDQVLQQLGDKVLKQQGVAGYDVHQTDQGTGDAVPSGRNFLLEDVPSGSKRPSNLTNNLPLTLPTNHSTNLPFCTSSQSLSVAKVGHNTEAMTAVMTSYGALMGQMAKGMLEGVGPQLMSMLHYTTLLNKLH